MTARFLRAQAPGVWTVHLDDEVVGVVYAASSGYRAMTNNGGVPMPNGSVLSTSGPGRRDRRSYEDRVEPLHDTVEDAARMIVLAKDTSRIIHEQVEMERAHGWSTD